MKKEFNELLVHKTILIKIEKAKRALNFIALNEISRLPNPEEYFKKIEYDEDTANSDDYIYKPTNPLKIELGADYLNIYFQKHIFEQSGIIDYFISICINDTPLYCVDYKITDFGISIENEELYDAEMNGDNLALIMQYTNYLKDNGRPLENEEDIFTGYIKEDENESKE